MPRRSRSACSFTTRLRMTSTSTTWSPSRHCPRSLSGVRMRTCSPSRPKRAAVAASLFGDVELGPQLRRHPLVGLVGRKEIVAEGADGVVERDGDVRDLLLG